MYSHTIPGQSNSRSIVQLPQRHYTSRHVEEMIAQRVAELEQTINALRTRQRQLEERANHDALTGLANRALLQDRFACAVERAKRSGEAFALLVIDLDGFKAVNDTFGHAAGDEVLLTVSKRLSAALRTCDSAARVGGDEFVVIIESVNHTGVVASIIEKLRSAVSEVISVKSGAVVTIGASVGSAIYPEDGATLAQMTAEADQKMYQSKKQKNSFAPTQ